VNSVGDLPQPQAAFVLAAPHGGNRACSSGQRAAQRHDPAAELRPRAGDRRRSERFGFLNE
jgi:hypothetical protein